MCVPERGQRGADRRVLGHRHLDVGIVEFGRVVVDVPQPNSHLGVIQPSRISAGHVAVVRHHDRQIEAVTLRRDLVVELLKARQEAGGGGEENEEHLEWPFPYCCP